MRASGLDPLTPGEGVIRRDAGQRGVMSTPPGTHRDPGPGEPEDVDQLSTPQLMSRLSQQTSELVSAELRLAKAEIQQSVKHAGLGVGMFGGAGVLVWFAIGTLVAAAVLALDLVLPAWAAALVVAGLLLAAAGVLGLTGKKQVDQATPPVPATQTNVQRDVEAVKEARHHD